MRKVRQHINLRHPPRRLPHPPRAIQQLAPQLSKYPPLNLPTPLLRRQNLRLILLQLRSSKPLRIHQRLLPLIVRRNRLSIRLRHLQVVPKHALNRTFSDPIPVLARSRSSIAASACRPLRLNSRSSSSSASTPARITPPSAKLTGGSSAIVLTTNPSQILQSRIQQPRTSANSSPPLVAFKPTPPPPNPSPPTPADTPASPPAPSPPSAQPNPKPPEPAAVPDPAPHPSPAEHPHAPANPPQPPPQPPAEPQSPPTH